MTSVRLVVPVLDDGGGVRAHLALTAHEDPRRGRFAVSEAMLVYASGAREDAMTVFGGDLASDDDDDDSGSGGESRGVAGANASKWKRGGRVVQAEWRES